MLNLPRTIPLKKENSLSLQLIIIGKVSIHRDGSCCPPHSLMLTFLSCLSLRRPCAFFYIHCNISTCVTIQYCPKNSLLMFIYLSITCGSDHSACSSLIMLESWEDMWMIQASHLKLRILKSRIVSIFLFYPSSLAADLCKTSIRYQLSAMQGWKRVQYYFMLKRYCLKQYLNKSMGDNLFCHY